MEEALDLSFDRLMMMMMMYIEQPKFGTGVHQLRFEVIFENLFHVVLNLEGTVCAEWFCLGI